MASLVAVVWMILTLPKPAQPYGWAFLGVVFVFAMWKAKRDEKKKTNGKIDTHDAWCREYDEAEESND